MHQVSGDVWTQGDNGWNLRFATLKDYQRRGLLRAWQRGEMVTDEVTFERRPMRYADVLKALQEGCLTEVECAA